MVSPIKIFDRPRTKASPTLAEVALQIWHDGNLQIAVLDWHTYPPPPGKYYDDNSGFYVLDIFVINRDQEEGFNRFKDALFEANPNDYNVKSYLGR